MPDSTAPITLIAQEICRDSLLEKYTRDKATSIREVRRRVAHALALALALAQSETEEQRAPWEKIFLRAQ